MKIGKEIIRLGTIDSTNAFATDLAEKGAAHGTVVVAENQTKGKGRLGRIWVSPPGGNIYMSIILRPPTELRNVTLLTVMAGVACARAMRRNTGLTVELKWPNDLMVSGRKLGGILTEVKSKAGSIVFAIVGIGVNVNVRMEDLPSDVRRIATSVRNETTKEQSKDVFISDILDEFDTWYESLVEDKRELILDEWRGLTSMLGRTVQVTTGSETLTGIADDLDEKGFLIMRLPSGIKRKIDAGDLTILR